MRIIALEQGPAAAHAELKRALELLDKHERGSPEYPEARAELEALLAR